MEAVIIAAAASIFTAILGALWSVGGQSALQRRTMKQELELAKTLPEGLARRQLLAGVQDRALLYRARQLGLDARQRISQYGWWSVGSGIVFVGWTIGASVVPSKSTLRIPMAIAATFSLSATCFLGGMYIIAGRQLGRVLKMQQMVGEARTFLGHRETKINASEPKSVTAVLPKRR